MISLINKSLDIKLAGFLLCIMLIMFSILIISFNRSQSAGVEALTGRISQLAHEIDDSGMDRNSRDKIGEIRESLKELPGGLKSRMFGGILLTSALCLAFVMASVGIFFRWVFFKPLKELTRGLESSIKGNDRDLTVRLAFRREDEVGTLAALFDSFIANLEEIIRNIGSKTESIAAASSELSVVSEHMDGESSDLYARSNSVAAAAEEMNTSMHTVAAASEEASTNISMVAGAAGQMQSNISRVAENCDAAREISNNAKQQVDTATENVGNLGVAANEISNVTQVITDIAEQTNLLALNATIEAARAGEAGKGFAVVANEIKDLALKTSEATRTIREKVEGIQSSTDDTVGEVGKISKVITDVDNIVQEIVLAIEEQSSTASEVADNIEQASIGISEVNENVAQSSLVASEIASDIAQVDGVAAEMSGRASQMSGGSRDMDKLSLDLRKMIGIFRVSGSTGSAAGTTLNEGDIPDLMPWSPRLQTSIREIDDQHRELVRLVNLLHKAMKMQKGAGEVGSVLNDLAEYTVSHFAFEEELFDKYHYPDTVAHKKGHQALLEKVGAFQKDFNDGRASVTMDLMDFLTDWLRSHIMKTDMAYTSFLKEKM